MTAADRLAKAVEERLPEIVSELDSLYDLQDIGWKDGVEGAVNEIRAELTAYRSAPPVDTQCRWQEHDSPRCENEAVLCREHGQRLRAPAPPVDVEACARALYESLTLTLIPWDNLSLAAREDYHKRALAVLREIGVKP